MITIPTEAIGSIPRTQKLMEAQRLYDEGKLDSKMMEIAYDEAVVEAVKQFEATGSPVLSDGEQRKTHSFVTYSVEGGITLPQMVSRFLSKMGM